jgi:hypothetical protein
MSIAANAAALLTAATASAHSYGVLINSDIPSAANSGGQVELYLSDFVSTSCSDFVNHEFWYGTVAGAEYWVEVGFKDGLTGSGGCVTNADFWADNRPNGGGYHEHYPNNGWSFDTWYTAEITSSGSCEWSVTLGGANLGTSTANCAGTGRYLAGGIESTNTSDTFCQGYLYNWKEQPSPSGSAFTSGWSGPGLSENEPPYIEWANGSDTETEEVLNESF